MLGRNARASPRRNMAQLRCQLLRAALMAADRDTTSLRLCFSCRFCKRRNAAGHSSDSSMEDMTALRITRLYSN
eukprot:Skav218902  [mRNA]  locus=scaffold328:362588:363497:+ [translate_table: standard]